MPDRLKILGRDSKPRLLVTESNDVVELDGKTCSCKHPEPLNIVEPPSSEITVICQVCGKPLPITPRGK